MKFMSVGKDGGPESPVTAFYILEIKSLFSIVVLKFNPGCRENYHSHAFNAYTWWLKGRAEEHILKSDDQTMKYEEVGVKVWTPSWYPKYTPREHHHKIAVDEPTYALSFRGPWQDSWWEYDPAGENTILLTHGRKIVAKCSNRRLAYSGDEVYLKREPTVASMRSQLSGSAEIPYIDDDERCRHCSMGIIDLSSGARFNPCHACGFDNGPDLHGFFVKTYPRAFVKQACDK